MIVAGRTAHGAEKVFHKPIEDVSKVASSRGSKIEDSPVQVVALGV
jgi:hypothetical protein